MTAGVRQFCLGVAIASLTACGAKSPAIGGTTGSAGLTPLELQRKIAQIAGQANGAAPAAVDPDTRLDGAKAGPGLTLTVRYTLVNAEKYGVGPGNFASKLAATIRKGSCANSDLRPLIDQGVVVFLEYRDLKGGAIGTLKIDRQACTASN